MLATVAEMSRTSNLMRLVFTPVKSAAVRLPPVASTWRPNLVRDRTTAPITTNPTDHTTTVGTGPMLPEPKMKLNESLRIGTGAELVIHWAVPTAIPSMPRVTRNDGIPSRLTSDPLIAPTTSPTTSPARIPGSTPQLEMVIAVTTLDRPATDPTLRSISAAEIANVIPTAMTVIVAVCRRMFMRLLLERNPSLRSITEKMRKTTTKPM